MKFKANKKAVKWIGYILMVIILGPSLIVMMFYCMEELDAIWMKEVNSTVIQMEIKHEP